MLFGSFDLLHSCQLDVFKEARAYGDHVTVILARDDRITELKGHEPLHNENERAEFLSHIDLIDEVLLGDKIDVYRHVRERKPNTIVLGYDQEQFVSGLKTVISEEKLDTNIVRLHPHKEETHKSGKIKSYLESQI